MMEEKKISSWRVMCVCLEGKKEEEGAKEWRGII